jgi:hypothetical protein
MTLQPIGQRRLALPIHDAPDGQPDISGRPDQHGQSFGACESGVLDLALDEDGHTPPRVLPLPGMVDGDTGTESGGKDALPCNYQGLSPVHVENCLILPGERGVKPDFSNPEERIARGEIVEHIGCRQQSLNNTSR